MALSPWAILLCKFSDQPVEPYPPDYYRELFLRPREGFWNLADYFLDASCGTADLSGNEVFGWLELDHPRADFIGSGAHPEHRYDLIEWGKQAAQRAGLDLTAFPVIGVLTNVNADLTGSYTWFTADGSIVDMGGYAHEMGHALGLGHSRIEGSLEDYADPWDVMSWDTNVFTTPHPRFGSMGPGLNVANADAIGWLATRVADNAWGPVELRPRHRWDLPGYLAAKVKSFYIEFRTPDRWDAAIDSPCVLVHSFEDGHSYLMRSLAGPAALGEGDVFQHASTTGFPYRIGVEVLRIDMAAETATVSVDVKMPSVPGLGGGGSTPK